jgi:succinoglycan biosynthesis transport protein ExoP
VVTSPCSGEGRTTIATRLGMSLAASGCHVLLIDGDLRKPSLNRQFGMIEEPGVSDVLQDRDGVVVPTGYPRLDLLGAGTPAERAMELPSIVTFRELLQTFAGSSDYVIIDAPPLEFSEALVMCAVATDVLLVVRDRSTTKEALTLAQTRLNPLRSKVLGIIINDDCTSPLAGRGSSYRIAQAGVYSRRRASLGRRSPAPHLNIVPSRNNAGPHADPSDDDEPLVIEGF